MGYVNADKLIKDLTAMKSGWDAISLDGIIKALKERTVDAVEVVRCHECIMHNKCNTEEAYKLCRIENPFCCIGRHREPQTEAVEENSFLMQRFMKQE